MSESFFVTNDAEVERAVLNAKTGYDVTDLGDSFQPILDDAKRSLYVRTGSTEWYEDPQYGQALVAMAALKSKEKVENVEIQSYGIGDEQLTFHSDDPSSSQQIQSWTDEMQRALRETQIEFQTSGPSFRNTAGFIG